MLQLASQIAEPKVGTAYQAALSMGQVHSIVKPYFKPQPGIYWFDFLTSFSVGLIAYSSVRFLGFLTLGQTAAYLVSVVAFYRAALFIHEIAHFRKRSMQTFTVVWNVLFGIPFLMPSFTYTTHLEHHSRKNFATHHKRDKSVRIFQDSTIFYGARDYKTVAGFSERKKRGFGRTFADCL